MSDSFRVIIKLVIHSFFLKSKVFPALAKDSFNPT